MTKIEEKFKELADKKETALIIGTVPGYPDLKTSFEIVKTIIESGADILELSSSFSDPVADGPTLVHAHQKVLSSGITKKQIFAFYKKITENFDTPIFVIEYVNVIYKIGADKYFKELRKSGVDSLIVPDVPIEELEFFSRSASKNNVDLALLVAPTTPDYRARKIISKSKGFVYCVSVTGITGARKSIASSTIDFIKRVKKLSALPLVVGFGISKPEHVRALSKSGAKGAVTCSKIINIIDKNISDKSTMHKEIRKYVSLLKQST